MNPATLLILLLLQERRDISLAFNTVSTDGGKTWAKPREIGPGLFGHVACNALGHVVVTWEKFVGQGDFKNDGIKALGVAISIDRGQSFRIEKIDDDARSQIRVSPLLHPDGKLELMWVDRRGKEPKLSRRTLRVE